MEQVTNYSLMAKIRKYDLNLSLEYNSAAKALLNGGKLKKTKLISLNFQLFIYLLMLLRKRLFYATNRHYLPDSPFNISLIAKIP